MHHYQCGDLTPILSTAHAPHEREYSCGDSPLATLPELLAYAAQFPYQGYRFEVVDLTDIFDYVLILTGDAGQPIDQDQDVMLVQVEETLVSDDGEALFNVGGLTWGTVPALVGTRDGDRIHSTAGAVRTYAADMAELYWGEPEETIATIMGAFDSVTELSRDDEPCTALVSDLTDTGVVLA